MAHITWAIFLFIATPYIVLNFANQPSADDYSYANKAIELGFLGAQKAVYEGWSGRYTATALLTFNPVVWKSVTGYQWLSLANQLLLFLSFWYFLRSLCRWLKWNDTLPIALLAVTLLSHFRGSNQGLYWMAGYLNYTLPMSLLLFAGGLFFRYHLPQKKRWLDFTVFPLLLILSIGCNEIIMLQLAALVTLLLGYSVLKKSPHRLCYFTWFLVCLVSSLVVYLAPGNSVRASLLTGLTPPLALVRAFLVSFEHLVQFTSVSLVAMILLMGKKGAQTDHWITTWRPRWTFLLILATLTVGFFPSYYSMGHQPQSRADNMFYVQFLLLLFVLLVQSLQQNRAGWRTFFEKRPYLTERRIFALFLLGSLLHPNNLMAWRDMFHMGSYNKYYAERMATLEAAKGQEVLLPAMKESPLTTIHFSNISKKKDHWKNIAVSSYFQLGSVRLTKEDQ